MKRFARMVVACSLAACALGAGFARPAAALELMDNKLQLHGFGDQGYLLTSHNKWLEADSKGTFNFNHFGLLVSAHPQEDLTIWAQLFSENTSSIRLDWGFVDYKFSDQLRVRGGQLRDPVGLLSEIRDVKYLQVSTIKPLIYQEEAEMMAESLRGASLIYAPEALNGNLSIDLFGGQPVFFEGENAEEKVRNLIGGRISYKTPIEGLTVLASASTSHEERPESNESGRQNLYMGSIDYANYNIGLRSEYAYLKDINIRRYGYYVQGAYTFFEKLTPFVRYDYITMDKDNRSERFNYQKDIVLGVGYKFNANVSFKVENHILNGYALPAHREVNEAAGGEVFEMPQDSSAPTHWNLFAASLNFIF